MRAHFKTSAWHQSMLWAGHIWFLCVWQCLWYYNSCTLIPVSLWTGKERKTLKSFPNSSVSKESTCNAGYPGSIPGLGRSAGEGIGYPLQYSWASPVAQLVKNLPTMREPWVWSLVWEDPLEKGMATWKTLILIKSGDYLRFSPSSWESWPQVNLQALTL